MRPDKPPQRRLGGTVERLPIRVPLASCQCLDGKEQQMTLAPTHRTGKTSNRLASGSGVHFLQVNLNW